ncbi:hypothetical protein [Rhizobium sp. BK661]|uniref:hypothetical protein n=1 Tax=Rhizobium sp. BK661 TaxID=2586991 RepID=UPI002168C130|nr:hypothetical protein [Rhizobium sp. BK661]MCS3741970.1 hypothetical protein [Rhizobium sp. BK661]
MTKLIDIKPGQWVLAFYEPYGPMFKAMPEHLEMFAHRGGGWDSHRKTEMFHIHRVSSVKPKTYLSDERIDHPYAYQKERLWRSHVISAGPSKETMITLRDKLFAVGVETSDLIEAEMYRRIEKFAARKRAAAERKIHRLLPHFFGVAQ